MQPENFVYWLQGYFELSNATCLDEQQIDIVREHLDLVFEKKTKTVYGPGCLVCGEWVCVCDTDEPNQACNMRIEDAAGPITYAKGDDVDIGWVDKPKPLDFTHPTTAQPDAHILLHAKSKLDLQCGMPGCSEHNPTKTTSSC